jgi:hypothetical protein
VRRAERDGAAYGEVADLGHRVGDGCADLPEEAERGGRVRAEVDVGSELEHRALAAPPGESVDERLGQLAERLVPRDALPAAAAARAGAAKRVQQARRAEHEVAARGALLAAARVPVGDGRVRGDVGRRLLLAPDEPVLHVQVPRAGGDAVDVRVGAARDALPRPALAPEVAPVAVVGRRGVGGARRGEARRQTRQRERQHAGSAFAQELAPGQLGHAPSLRT